MAHNKKVIILFIISVLSESSICDDIGIFPVTNFKRNKHSNLSVSDLEWYDLYERDYDCSKDIENDMFKLSCRNVRPGKFDNLLLHSKGDIYIDLIYRANDMINYIFDITDCAEKVEDKNPIISSLYQKCPDRCNLRPCLLIEHAFEDSCESYLMNKGLNDSFFHGEYDNQFKYIEILTDEYRKTFKFIFSCKCHDNYEWTKITYPGDPDSSGICVLKTTRNMNPITCVTGIYNINYRETPRCKLLYFV